MLSRTSPNLSRHLEPVRFDGAGPVAAAVSGGSDSLGLLLALADLRDRYGGPDILAVTVDHGLRPGSADEACRVAEICRSMGIDHETRRWTESRPESGIQARARAARRLLLAETARAAGSTMVLTGHTLDDQRETVAMRQMRGDGEGLAGMAPASLADPAGSPVWFVRPMLGVTRDALREALVAAGIRWIDDPSNVNPAFERVRVRQALDGRENTLAALDGIRQRAAAARIGLSGRAALLIRDQVRTVAPGLIRIDRAALEGGEAMVAALRILLAHMGETEHRPAADKVAGIVAGFLRGGFRRATLSRVLMDLRRDGLYLLREIRGSERPVRAGAGGRTSATVEGGRPPAPPALIRSAAAAARQDAAAAPSLHPWNEILPLFDLAAALALAELTGAAPLPESPFPVPIDALP